MASGETWKLGRKPKIILDFPAGGGMHMDDFKKLTEQLFKVYINAESVDNFGIENYFDDYRGRFAELMNGGRDATD